MWSCGVWNLMIWASANPSANLHLCGVCHWHIQIWTQSQPAPSWIHFCDGTQSIDFFLLSPHSFITGAPSMHVECLTDMIRVSHWSSATRCFRTLVHKNYKAYELQFCMVITLDHLHPAHQVLRNSIKDCGFGERISGCPNHMMFRPKYEFSDSSFQVWRFLRFPSHWETSKCLLIVTGWLTPLKLQINVNYDFYLLDIATHTVEVGRDRMNLRWHYFLHTYNRINSVSLCI